MTSISVLLIEDDEDDYLLTRDLLMDVPNQTYDLTWRTDPESGVEALQSGDFDVCLIDYRLGKVTGVEVLKSAKEAIRATPAILLTGEHSPRSTNSQCSLAPPTTW